ncbi:cytochrome P450 monooxygenase 2 [Microdochium nivale]|nr:cytochrome P450 monooxygenase 2 [Microdochium nivale]
MAASSSSIPFSEHVAPALLAIQENPRGAFVVTAALLLAGCLLCTQDSVSAKSAGFPQLADQTPEEFQINSVKTIERGRAQYKDKPFTLKTSLGYYTILSPELGHELRNESGLNFMQTSSAGMHSYLPGFEPFKAGDRNEAILQSVIRKQLVKSLSQIALPLSTEASLAIDHNLGSSTAWRSIQPYPAMLDIIARLSSLIFLGKELCRDEEWLSITKLYTVNSIEAALELSKYPVWTRRVVNAWFLPKGRLVRQQVANANRLINRLIEERRERKRSGKVDAQYCTNAIDWFEEESAGMPYEPGRLQLMMSTVATHTTSDLLTETMLRIAQEPEFIEELRDEIKSVLIAEGAWTKNALFNLKLLDSALKEAQRLRPSTTATMTRIVLAPTPVPGTDRILPVGAQTLVSSHLRLDPDVYEQPHKYIGRRFADMRANGETKLPVHLVSTGMTSLSFGHGNHACPGRFFAATELKIALCHLLIKYDWEVDQGQNASGGAVDMTPRMDGVAFGVNTSVKLRIRKRTPEEMGIDLDTIRQGTN